MLGYLQRFCQNPRRSLRRAVERFRYEKLRRAGRPIVIFERPGGMGDVICSFPAVLALRERHPDALLVYAVLPEFKPVVEMGRVADFILETYWTEDMYRMNERRCDVYYRPRLENEERGRRADIHLIDDFCENLGVNPASRRPRLYPPARAVETVARSLSSLRRPGSKLVALQVGPSWPVREWAGGKWNRLVALLKKNLDCTILQVGSDYSSDGRIVRSLRVEGAIDQVGTMALEEVFATIASVDLFVGIDSGLLHAAAALDAPCLGLFGAIDPHLRLHPGSDATAVTSDVPCLGCHHRLPRLHWQENCPYDIACMKQLEPELVAEAALRLLSNRREPSHA